jgi:hypothetical protein
MLRQGANVEEVVKEAIGLSREAYRNVAQLERKLDTELGSPHFRRDKIDPLLDKERQIEAIRNRAQRGGKTRTSDTQNLNSLLGRKTREYDTLRMEFPWCDLTLNTRKLVKDYLAERRAQLALGDAEKVRAAYLQAIAETALAS